MLDTGTPPTGSAHQTAHTATFATEFEDLYAPAWVRMLLEQQANANRLMLEQQANINRLLEGLLVGQGPRSQHSRSMPDRNTPNSPHLPDDARDERNNARDKGNVVRDKHTPPAPQLFVRSLRPEEIATFNPSSGDDVEVFCRRIQDMAAVKSQAAICETLLQCLRSTATDWYTNLSEIEHAQLRASTSAWTRLLRDRFGMSVTEAHSALSNLRYDIASDYHAYHERKIRLARIAGINTEQVVHYIFAGMPFEMRNALASSLEGKEAGDLNVFRLRCLAQRATLLTRRSEQRQTPAPAFNQTVQAPRPHQNSWGIDSEGVATPSSSSGQVSEEEMGPGSNTPSRTTYRGAASNNAPSQLQDIYRMNWAGGRGDTRAWSVLLGSSTDLRHDPDGKNWEDQRWVAVGIMADPAVYIYPIRQSQSGKGVELGEAWRIASTGERMSVYAMATPPPGSLLPAFLLFVGFYDGVVRVYDTRQLHPRSTAEGEGEIEALNGALTQLTLNGTPRRRRIRRELNPIAVFREEFDADAIYSLSFGGPQGTMVVVGGARHAKVRVFDAEMLSGYDLPLLSAPVGVEGERQGSRGGDWTAFALHSTDSPKGKMGKGKEEELHISNTKM
ncbi:uncharacterized protein UBRO2_02748 [Ustilago bromivora]|uniref:Uncharacterized protein n=1 Tax=Ustilago bromivora TaxID=307758 RepID=A0A8H8QLI8_9BASI|nr:uncharacterized protein UBRO2_02748 [Ustilago bromivora]